ncbi:MULTISPECIES: hypothetical protein [unclassified Ruegeria]|uniref:hypothetical protein n=1 Tax=unclassified Ruegeria TaxID=2625375 RepID=UPI001AE1FDF4|nr:MULTISPECIES: hypothetical protein [unclassified Ruegeria]
MKTSLLAVFCSCLLGSIAFAQSLAPQAKQSRNGVIFRCDFENQRTVILSALDDRIVWQENGSDYPASDWAHIRISHDPILSVFAYGVGIGSPRLDIYQGIFHADKPGYDLRTAILSETLVGRERLIVEAVEGFCQGEQQN